nr:RecName: Full=Bradykinin-potentiating peptide 11; Short=BPP-11 [Bothrops neuwiedi]
QWPRPTPQIPP